MEIKEMSVEQLEARKAEIANEVESAETAEVVEARTTELKEIKDELEARKVAFEEKKAEARKALEEGKEIEKIEEKKEERKMFEVNSVEYRNAWVKNLMGKELSVEERTALTGSAAVIPTQTMNEIVMRLKENALLGKIDMMQFKGYVRIPVYSTDNAASWTTSASDSADAVTYIDLKPYQLIKTVQVPADIDKMSIDAFESYVVRKLVDNIESALQKAVIVGTGSTGSQAEGISVTHSTADGTFTKAAITKKDLMTIMGKLPADFQKNAVWIMPNAVFYEAMAVAELHNFAGVSAGMEPQIGGKPVIVDDNCVISSTDTIFYGDPSHYKMNIGEGVKVDKDLSVEFRSNNAVYRGVCMADGKLDLAEAFVKYTRATA